MCGIFGFFAERRDDDALAAARVALDRALAALGHRGPDDRDSLIDGAGEVVVGFAHTRLAILDLTPAGHQPMRGPNGEGLILNGEIYNHLALRPALEATGVVFTGTSDTETLLHLLIREGPAALDRLVGMFAFAFWDPARRALLLARDRFGKKPLYLVEHPSLGLVFASEVRALLATGAAARELDPDGLARWLARGSCHDPTTLVRGVRSLRPGHTLTIDAAGTRTAPYWELTPSTPPPDWRDQLEALLDDAVKARLISDRPIGVFLSGGVDSAAIASVAARHALDALEAFTLTFDEAAWDEGARARATATYLGLRHHASHLQAAEALAEMERALAAQDLPSHDGFNTWFVARAARHHGLVVALAGTGGDELFGGYPHFRRWAAMLRFGAITRHLPSSMRERLAAGAHPALPTRVRKAFALAATEGRPEAVYAIVREMFPPLIVARLLGHALTPAPALTPALTPAPDLTQLELANYMVDTQLRDIDAMSMAHALEVRSPLLDHRLAQAVLSLPPAAKAPARGINKRLLVELAGLPPELFRAPKRGFVIPWDDWLRGPLASWTAAHLSPDAVTETRALDPQVVAQLVDAFRRRRGIAASRILSLIALVAWCRRHDVRGLGVR